MLTIQEEDELCVLYTLANEVNQLIHNNRVSFVRNRNINYTNVCKLNCTFCAYNTPHSEEGYVLTKDDITAKIGEHDISEVSFQGGLNDDLPFSYVKDLLTHIKFLRPEIHIHGFSPMEIYYYAHREHRAYRYILEDLHDHGLDSLCGTAAEILDDAVRACICPEKLLSEEWCTIMKEAHHCGLPSTATILFGHIEKPMHIANHFRMIRSVQQETNMITEFIPLSFMPYNTPLGRQHNIQFSGLAAAKRITACARLFFYSTITNIQVSWVKLGLAGAVDCLSVGANDIGGTLFEEHITRAAGGTHGQGVSAHTLTEAIKKAGKQPVIRDTVYSFQKDYVGV